MLDKAQIEKSVLYPAFLLLGKGRSASQWIMICWKIL